MNTEKTNITKAILAVMNDVKNIDKNMSVGSGNYGYKGVADKDVKLIIGQAMQKHGLAIVPTSISPNMVVERWEEGGKQKQSVFTEVQTKYLLIHESGESIEVSGYGQGVDSQDKSAGKATTYALKYTLLYLFMVPTGSIDDTDTTHSNEAPTPKPKKQYDDKPWLNANTDNWKNVVVALRGEFTIADILKKYNVSKANQEKLMEEAMQ